MKRKYESVNLSSQVDEEKQNQLDGNRQIETDSWFVSLRISADKMKASIFSPVSSIPADSDSAARDLCVRTGSGVDEHAARLTLIQETRVHILLQTCS